MKNYIKLNIIPIIIELIFIISCLLIKEENIIYTNFLFYLILLIYFIITRNISIKNWIKNLKSGKKFWKQVFITFLGLMLAFLFTTILENKLSMLDSGMIKLRTDSWLKIIIFTLSTIFLPAIVEETFFRKNMIIDKNKKVLIISTLFSMFLFGLEHALSIWGIFLTMLWALPLSISYIKTKNIYIPMTAHFIGNVLCNGIDIIFIIISML